MALSIERIIELGGVTFSIDEYKDSRGEKRQKFDSQIEKWKASYGDGNLKREEDREELKEYEYWSHEGDIEYGRYRTMKHKFEEKYGPLEQEQKEGDKDKKKFNVKLRNPINEIRKRAAFVKMTKAKHTDLYLGEAGRCISLAGDDDKFIKSVIERVKRSSVGERHLNIDRSDAGVLYVISSRLKEIEASPKFYKNFKDVNMQDFEKNKEGYAKRNILKNNTGNQNITLSKGNSIGD